MKKTLSKLMKMGLPFLGVVVFGGMAQAAFLTGFDVPPYTLNGTVVGTQGWTTYGTSSASTNALVIQNPMNASDTLLRLRKTATGDASVRIKNNSFTAFTGTVYVDVAMAFDFNPASDTSTATTVAFADLSQVTSPVSFGVDYATAGGLFYGINSTRTVFLTKSNIKMNSIYLYSMKIDLVAKLFDLSVTGTLADNSPLNYSISNVSFNGLSGNSLSSIYMEISARQNYISYIDSVAISSVPEPSSLIMISLGAFLLGNPLVRGCSRTRRTARVSSR